MSSMRYHLPWINLGRPSAVHCTHGPSCLCRHRPFGQLLFHAPDEAAPTRARCGYTAGWVTGVTFHGVTTCEVCRAMLGLPPDPLPDGWVITFRDAPWVPVERSEMEAA